MKTQCGCAACKAIYPYIVGFKDLSTSLKILTVLNWIVAGTFAIGFFIGFIGALI